MNKSNKILLVFILMAEMCFGQKYKSEVPKIDNSFEKFDISVFPDTADKYIRDKKKDPSGKTIFINSDISHYVENDSLHFELKNYYRAYADSPISGYDFSLNPIIGIYKEFYKNGNIKRKGLYCILGFNIGYWYSYDENGKLAKSENFDAGYTFNYRKVLNYCLRHNISIKRNFESGRATSIRKYKNNWYIEFPQPMKRFYKTIQIDGTKGKILPNTSERPFEVYRENVKDR